LSSDMSYIVMPGAGGMGLAALECPGDACATSAVNFYSR
jgi:hypothetical protein